MKIKDKKRDSHIFLFSIMAVLFSLFILLYLPTLSVLHLSWSEMHQAYAHGYVVLALTLYLLYLSRDKIFHLNQSITAAYFFTGLVAILICSALWFLAVTVQVQVIQLIAVIFIVWLWIAVVFGKSSSISALLPLGLLFLAMPLWDGLMVYLQAMTIVVTQAFLSAIGIIAYVNETYIYLVDGIIEVAEECSGLKYLLAGVSLGIVYAELNCNNIRRKIIIVLLAAIVSILANWIRVIFLVLIADISKMQSSMLDNHDNLGWVVFIGCFIFFILLAGKIADGDKPDNSQNKSQPSTGRLSGSVNNYYFRVISATLVASLLPVLNWSVTAESNSVSLSHQYHETQASKLTPPSWLPDYASYDEQNTWRIAVGAQNVDITLMSYRNQKQGKELIYFSNKLTGDVHALKNLSSMAVSETLNVNRSVLKNRAGNRLIAWYFKVGHSDTNSPVKAKILQIESLIQGVPIASLVTISVECSSSDCREEQESVITPELTESIVQSISVHEGQG